jgi:glycyl-tRNA synthetase (class II)
MRSMQKWIDKGGKSFADYQVNVINDVIDEMTEEDKEKLKTEFDQTGEATINLPSGKAIKLNKDFIAFETGERNQVEEKYTPSVIEPSFGKY